MSDDETEGQSARAPVSLPWDAGMTGADRLMETGGKSLVGVVHLPPLAGPRTPGPTRILERVASDARAYAEAGFDGILVENFGDTPFPKGGSAPYVAALMTRAVTAARTATGLPVGANVLRNDPYSALGACYAAGGAFVRVNVYTGAVLTDQGIVDGAAHDLERQRERLGLHRPSPEEVAPVLVLADLDVKHSSPLAKRTIEQEASDAVHRAAADILIVTGPETGREIDDADIDRVRRVTGTDVPIWAGSGVHEKNADHLLDIADGAIVGTGAKVDGVVTNPVDPRRAQAIVDAARGGRR